MNETRKERKKENFIFKNINNILLDNNESKIILNKLWVEYVSDKWLIYFETPYLNPN